MPTTDEIIKTEFESLQRDLISAYDEKGMRASGNWADELEVDAGHNTVKLLGEKYTEQLEYGRRSGGFPPIQMIEDWIVSKGIKPIEDSMTNRTLAFLIARKIARSGWKRSRFGGVDLVTEVITPERIQKILDKVVEGKIFTVGSEITRLMTNLNAA